MDFLKKEMNESLATEILNWKYEKPYDFYNNELSDESLKEMLDASYYALLDEREGIYGFYCVGEAAKVPAGYKHGAYNEQYVDMGLGMNPALVGKGNGFAFCTYILQQIQEKHEGIPIRLTVATFNKRAIHLYEKLGFVKKKEFSTDFAEFITMVK